MLKVPSVGYNSVAIFICPDHTFFVASQICEILRKFEQFKFIQGHRSWCQSKAHNELPTGH